MSPGSGTQPVLLSNVFRPGEHPGAHVLLYGHQQWEVPAPSYPQQGLSLGAVALGPTLAAMSR